MQYYGSLKRLNSDFPCSNGLLRDKSIKWHKGCVRPCQMPVSRLLVLLILCHFHVTGSCSYIHKCVQSAHGRLDFSKNDNTDIQSQQSYHQPGKIHTQEHATKHGRGLPHRKKNHLPRTKIPKTRGLLQVIPRTGLAFYPEYDQSPLGSEFHVSLLCLSPSTALEGQQWSEDELYH